MANVNFSNSVSNFLSSFPSAYVVGGAVRDAILGFESKDLDIEVFGLTFTELEAIASQFGKTDLVGASFGILKLQHPVLGEIDLSLPRRENKCGVGHKGFSVTPDPTLTMEEAASRRDFTFNALSWNPSQGLVDPFGGVEDLQNGVIRHTSPAFSEDPLRVLRAFQFAGRFDMRLAPETAELCQSLADEFSTLPVDRVWKEWEKWALKSTKPSAGLEALREAGWAGLFPNLAEMIGIPQDSEWHPEGDVWVHTLLVCDSAVEICNREGIGGSDRLVIVLAALCHDMAKPSCTQYIDGRIRSRGHEEAGEVPTREFLGAIGCPHKLIERIVPLVTNHLAHCHGEATERTVRRLANRLAPATIGELALLVEADHSGRPPLPKGCPAAMKAILEIAGQVKVQGGAPKQILQGKHLIELGYKPGKDFGTILGRAFQAQLDGAFACPETAKEWVKQNC